MSFVTNRREASLWEEAQNKLEWASTRYWEYVLKSQVFIGNDWALSSQQPPSKESDDRRQVDLAVETWNDQKWHIILFFEAKKQNCTQADIDVLEFQVWEACRAHFIYTKRKEMYAMTTIGTAARLWYVTIEDDIPLPLAPLNAGISDRSLYIESRSDDAEILRDGFRKILRYNKLPGKTLEVLRKNRSPKNYAQIDSNVRPTTPSGGMPAARLTYGAPGPITLPYNLGQPTGSSSANVMKKEDDWVLEHEDYDELREEEEGEGGEEDDEDEEGGDNNDPKQTYVELTLKVVEHMLRADEVFYCFGSGEKTRQIARDKWKKSKIDYKGKPTDCFLYTSRSNHKYWTWVLPKNKGKGKA